MSVYPPPGPGSGQYQPQPGYPGGPAAPYGPRPAAPGVVADRIAGGLLVVAALLIVLASFLVQGKFTADFSGDLHIETEVTAWGSKGDGDSTTQYLGVGMVLAGVVALVLAGLLLAGFAARRPMVRALGMFASGLALGVALQIIFAGVSNSNQGNDDVKYSFGVGFWLTVVVALLSLGALAASVFSFTEAPSNPPAAQQYPQQYGQQPNPAGQQYYPPPQQQGYGYAPQPQQYPPPGTP